MARQAYVEYANEHYGPAMDHTWPLNDGHGLTWLSFDKKSPFWKWMVESGKVDRSDSPRYIKLPLNMGNFGNGDIGAQERAYQTFVESLRKAGIQVEDCHSRHK